MVFESLKKTEGSPVEQYIRSRAVYFRCASQITPNQLVRQLSEAYGEAADSLQYLTDLGKVKDWCRAGLHPTVSLAFVDLGKGIVVRDLLHLIESEEPLLPHDLIDSLAFIAENKLVERVRAEVTPQKSAERLRLEEREAKRKKHFEEDLAGLKEQLAIAKNELSKAARRDIPHKENRVKHLEEQISKLEESGQPLSSWRVDTK